MLKNIFILASLITVLNSNASVVDSKVFKYSAFSRVNYTTATEEYKREKIKAQQIEIMEAQIETMNADEINLFTGKCTQASAEIFYNKSSQCFPEWQTSTTGNRFGRFNCQTTLTLNCIKN